MIEKIIIAVIGAALLAGIIYMVFINPNPKSITEHFRGNDEKYE